MQSVVPNIYFLFNRAHWQLSEVLLTLMEHQGGQANGELLSTREYTLWIMIECWLAKTFGYPEFSAREGVPVPSEDAIKHYARRLLNMDAEFLNSLEARHYSHGVSVVPKCATDV